MSDACDCAAATLRSTRDGGRNGGRRARLSGHLRELARKSAEERAAFSRQVDYDDLFAGSYEGGSGLTCLRPPYLPGKMYELYEENGVLQACVEAFVQNVHGFGMEVLPRSGVPGDQDPAAEAERDRLAELVAEPNPDESLPELCRKLRRDLEVTGNAYLEVLRDASGAPALLFWCDARRMRLTAKDAEPCEVLRPMTRGGVRLQVPTRQRFRRFVMQAGVRPRYFKEFGDPRPIDMRTGREFAAAEDGGLAGLDPESGFEPASEIIHLRHGNAAYGVPRWIGALLPVMGLPRAEFVNYDLFDSQGIPPLIVSVAGGRLSDESMDDLVGLFEKAKGVGSFHKLLVLEALAEGARLEGGEARPQLEVTNLAEHRREDALFAAYLGDCRRAIRTYGFRLPGLFVGETEQHNYATARIARELAEEQIFAPERAAFDQRLDRTLGAALGCGAWRLHTRAPVLRSSQEMLKLLPLLADRGALTVNELIRFVNEQFGATLEPYAGEWANRPLVGGPGAAEETSTDEGECAGRESLD